LKKYVNTWNPNDPSSDFEKDLVLEAFAKAKNRGHLQVLQVWVFLKIGIPQNFNIDGLEWKTLLKWISFGGKTHYFWTHPYI